MESAEPGVEVPMPTRPVLVIVKSVEVAEAVEDAIAKRVVFGEVSPVFA